MNSFQNVIDGRGLALTFAGMVIVYVALMLLTLSYYLLPKILEKLQSVFPGLLDEEETHHRESDSVPELAKTGFVAAIAFALHRRRLNNRG